MLSDLGRGIHTSATDRTREPFLLSRAEENGQSGRLLDTGGTVDLGRGIHTAATYIPSSRGTDGHSRLVNISRVNASCSAGPWYIHCD